MKRNYLYAILLFVIFFTLIGVAVIVCESDAREIRNGVLRFHIVANSNSAYDQQNKMSVRDGIAELCSELFYTADSKQEAMTEAVNNKAVIETAARQILKERGCDDSVLVTVTKRFFPTRQYEGVSLPAGVYDTVDVVIGDGDGQNFWCVMFPDICVGASSSVSNRDKMKDVLTGDSLEMVTDQDTPTVVFKFKVVEIFETVKNFFRSR